LPSATGGGCKSLAATIVARVKGRTLARRGTKREKPGLSTNFLSERKQLGPLLARVREACHSRVNVALAQGLPQPPGAHVAGVIRSAVALSDRRGLG
jgi:hypothetical protein